MEVGRQKSEDGRQYAVDNSMQEKVKLLKAKRAEVRRRLYLRSATLEDRYA